MKIVACAAALMGLGWLSQRLYEAASSHWSVPGKRISVGDKRIHIFELPADGRCIVMLPGMGTDVPSADFLPFARQLNAAGFRVLIVEPLGYGFSDGTREPRDVERVAGELHDALHGYGVKKDYILLGHSASGLTIRQWVARYPQEVAGIIGEDISLPAQFDVPEMSRMLADHGVMRALFAVSRFFGRLGVNSLLAICSKPLKEAAGGDAQLLKRYRAAFVRSRHTPVLRSEYQTIASNGRAVQTLPMPACPTLLLTANGKGSCESLPLRSGFSWVEAHRELGRSIPGSRCVEIPGAHYLHYGFVERMTREISDYFCPHDGTSNP